MFPKPKSLPHRSGGKHGRGEQKHTRPPGPRGGGMSARAGPPSSPRRVKSHLGRGAAAPADDRDSFPNYKNLLQQENFVQKANIYAGGGG